MRSRGPTQRTRFEVFHLELAVQTRRPRLTKRYSSSPGTLLCFTRLTCTHFLTGSMRTTHSTRLGSPERAMKLIATLRENDVARYAGCRNCLPTSAKNPQCSSRNPPLPVTAHASTGTQAHNCNCDLLYFCTRKRGFAGLYQTTEPLWLRGGPPPPPPCTKTCATRQDGCKLCTHPR